MCSTFILTKNTRLNTTNKYFKQVFIITYLRVEESVKFITQFFISHYIMNFRQVSSNKSVEDIRNKLPKHEDEVTRVILSLRSDAYSLKLRLVWPLSLD